MPTNHYAVAAVPATGATGLLRSGLVGRYAYCLASGESAADFVAIDPNTGDVCPALIQNGALYGLDNLDSTTAAGPTCLVSYDSKRYKLNSLTTPFSVLSRALASPPSSPVIGDAYLLYSTPSGAWAGKLGYIAIYTSRGWEFMLPPVGFRILVEDEEAFYFRKGGDWLAGLGSVLVSDNSIAPSKMLWDNRVQNQTTNTPPSAAQGVAFIVGPAPTDAWAGHAGKIAIRESAGTSDDYVIYTPYVGQTVYDINLATNVMWNGAGWIPQFSGYSNILSVSDPAWVTFSGPGGNDGGVSYSPTTPPTLSGTGKSVITETLEAEFAADVQNQKIEIEYSATLHGTTPITTGGGTNATERQITVAVYLDGETNAREWVLLFATNAGGNDWSDAWPTMRYIRVAFTLTLGDKDSHTAKIRFHFRQNSSGLPNNVTLWLARRNIIIRKRR